MHRRAFLFGAAAAPLAAPVLAAAETAKTRTIGPLIIKGGNVLISGPFAVGERGAEIFIPNARFTSRPRPDGTVSISLGTRPMRAPAI